MTSIIFWNNVWVIIILLEKIDTFFFLNNLLQVVVELWIKEKNNIRHSGWFTVYANIFRGNFIGHYNN